MHTHRQYSGCYWKFSVCRWAHQG